MTMLLPLRLRRLVLATRVRRGAGAGRSLGGRVRRRSSSTVGGISDSLLATISMNYGNSGSTHDELVSNLRKNALIKSDEVERVMRLVDRAAFCAPGEELPYEDKPKPIGGSRGATITSPHMHAIALEALREPLLREGCRSLDLGSGSGYFTACAALMAPRALAYGVEHEPELVAFAENNVLHRCKAAQRVAVSGGIMFVVDDGQNLRSPVFWEQAQFDAIHAGCAMPSVPTWLVRLLRPGGRALVPVYCGDGDGGAAGEQDLTLVTRRDEADEEGERETVMRVVYSPILPPPVDEAARAAVEAEAARADADLAAAAARLREWHASFLAAEGRKPSAAEIVATPAFREHQVLKKLAERLRHEAAQK